jgi:hypothetical protein
MSIIEPSKKSLMDNGCYKRSFAKGYFDYEIEENRSVCSIRKEAIGTSHDVESWFAQGHLVCPIFSSF